jgi:hypothetical protein
MRNRFIKALGRYLRSKQCLLVCWQSFAGAKGLRSLCDSISDGRSLMRVNTVISGRWLMRVWSSNSLFCI